MLACLLAFLLAVPQDTTQIASLRGGVRGLDWSRDGRVVFEQGGDLWVTPAPVPPGELRLDSDRVVQLTSGPAWDRDPAWMPDGETIVFASNRAGQFDLWTERIQHGGPIGAPQRITDAPENELEPAVGPDGTVVFVRGEPEASDLWLRTPGGELRRLTDREGTERSPAVSADGGLVAYVSELNDVRELRTLRLGSGRDARLVAGRAVEFPAWSPGGEQVAFTTRGSAAGVWVAAADGGYVNLVSRVAGEASWTVDGGSIVIAELPLPDPGYNGDPSRSDERTLAADPYPEGRLWVVPAPQVLDAQRVEVPVTLARDRAAHNAERFDGLWQRLAGLYYEQHGRAEWDALRSSLRPGAVAARTDAALDEVMDALLRQRPAMRQEATGRAAVSSAHPLATAAGLEILRAGGNVVDAAVAVSFALGVVEPDASGIGGYGEMVLYLRGMDAPAVVEFLTRVPEQATLGNAALLENGRLPDDGPVLANVPGTVAGMWTAWKRFGSGQVAWADLLEPAIRLAENGFVLDASFPTTLRRERHRFLKYEDSRRLFFPGGAPLQPGDTLKNPDLAWTLRQIAQGGADAFYRGEVGRRMVADLRGRGNAMTALDLARYFAPIRAPVTGVYRNHTVYSSAPAAGGGASLVGKLHLLDNVARGGLYAEDAAMAHAMIEAWKLAPSLSDRLADPGLWPVDLESALDRDDARTRWNRCFDPGRASGPDELRERGEGRPACEETAEIGFTWGEPLPDCTGLGGDAGCRRAGTTAFAVADADGNVVSVTQTLGTWGGNFYVSPGLGFLYNDKLRSYRTDPAAYGARLPYARHGTSIAPTLVFRGTGDAQRPVFAVGAAGNAWITSAVYQMVVAMADDETLGPQRALELPRFLVGVRRQDDAVRDIVIQVEDGFASDVMDRLRALGHRLQPISLRGELRMGYGAAVRIERDRVRAGGDPRRSGAAGAIP